MKLFQIEEPDGSPVDPDAPGAAIGLDAGGGAAEVALSVGGNAVALADREGFEHELPVPPESASSAAWQEMFEGARVRAERALARPVTHAVVVLRRPPAAADAARLGEAAAAAGLAVLRFCGADELPAGEAPVLAAAMLAEDLAPRPRS
ncbi:MAG TPA: hypothetical protein VFA12_14870 [Stellaceae bacterium]|nr:hypothetical protein [Stellaceae bacterium]